MENATPRIYRNDYQPPAFLVDTIDLTFSIGDERTSVRARSQIKRNPAGIAAAPLTLYGADLSLIRIAVDGVALPPSAYRIVEEVMTVPAVPDAFLLEVETEIDPAHNTALEGLYASGSMLCTQCEAEGFRRITWYPDRPDVMARFTTTMEADKARYPVLLSNGNRIASEALPNGRHRVTWQDPFPKPCYLFALVAGDLAKITDSFVTMSGRKVLLEIYCEHGKEDQLAHAMRSLKKSMRWDEERFGREYDLDQFMIVATSYFNAGAMENKGLNIFNAAYVLGRSETATDRDLQNIESVIAHEYFHNWSGNRVTCRDWFQLSLKEGLTVFRDQEFSSDMGSPVTERIDHVRGLRNHQFLEDAGPMAHPIRPDSYITIDNFYTATVYEKGAEVVRMLQTLFGRDGFRKGTDLYFSRHDGQAVTCDDFVKAIFDANPQRTDINTAIFQRWYEQSGTPRIQTNGHYDAMKKSYCLKLKQFVPAEKKPMLIPIAFGLLDKKGNDIPVSSSLLILEKEEQEFVFHNIAEPPTPSLLRDFSAPVILEFEESDAALALRMAHDTDGFNRWDAGQHMALKELQRMIAEIQQGAVPEVSAVFTDGFGSLLQNPIKDAAFTALAMQLPGEGELGQVLRRQDKKIDVDAIHAAREALRRHLAETYEDILMAHYKARLQRDPLAVDGQSMGERQLKNTCLAYLGLLAKEETDALAFAQAENAGNMTDAIAALGVLTHRAIPQREKAFAAFYEKWKAQALIVDKWFALQASADRSDARRVVQGLMEHPAFSIKNPNNVYALLGGFVANLPHFHAKDGSGYQLLGDVVLQLDKLNPQLAGRRLQPLTRWKDYDATRAEKMLAQLRRIAATEGLSKNTAEVAQAGLSESSET